MEDPDLELGELPGRQTRGLLLGGLPVALVRLVDERTDDEGLVAGAQLLADQLEGSLPLTLTDHPGLHGPATGRQLAERRRVEVAVGGQREGARYRRRGHVEDVRSEPVGRLRVERPALLDTEAVLLVDDAEPEAGKADRRLDQRVGADGEAELAAGEAIERPPGGGQPESRR